MNIPFQNDKVNHFKKLFNKKKFKILRLKKYFENLKE